MRRTGPARSARSATDDGPHLPVGIGVGIGLTAMAVYALMNRLQALLWAGDAGPLRIAATILAVVLHLSAIAGPHLRTRGLQRVAIVAGLCAFITAFTWPGAPSAALSIPTDHVTWSGAGTVVFASCAAAAAAIGITITTPRALPAEAGAAHTPSHRLISVKAAAQRP